MRWQDLMNPQIVELSNTLYEKANQMRQEGVTIFPPQNQIFRALKLTTPDNIKVCIIGQDPYHTPGAANGLAFSINKGRYIQPSLQNIFKELNDDLNIPIPDNGDLTPWAEQGVLLLNTSLTVTAGQANSHRDWGWQDVTKNIFNICLNKLPQPIVFILWGANAKNLAQDVDWNLPQYSNKLAIMSAHPSPMSANRGFFKSKPFSRTNDFLIKHNVQPIDWHLT